MTHPRHGATTLFLAKKFRSLLVHKIHQKALIDAYAKCIINPIDINSFRHQNRQQSKLHRHPKQTMAAVLPPEATIDVNLIDFSDIWDEGDVEFQPSAKRAKFGGGNSTIRRQVRYSLGSFFVCSRLCVIVIALTLLSLLSML